MKAEVLRLYRICGEISADNVQRKLRVSYRQACELIVALVDEGKIDAHRVRNVVDMGWG